VRGWTDALVFAFLLAMFIRTFVFELFMIPTGSMTPTLIGDDARQVCEMDWNGDGREDVVVLYPASAPRTLQVHLRNGDGLFDRELFLEQPDYQLASRLGTANLKGKGRRDMIMVNKFAYWFGPPDRGDVAVFKVPDRPGHPYDPTKPVYIKRCVGLPGEQLTVNPVNPYLVHPVGHPDRISPGEFGGVEYVILQRPLEVDGKPLLGEPFDRVAYFPPPSVNIDRRPDPEGAPERIQIGDSEVLMFGDNQRSSSDSRYWGGVPLTHMRGKAILRYLPLRGFGFLD